jgi:protein subunit release factor B
MQETRKPILSLTRDSFTWQYFRSGGKGGQNQNKVNSGVRCIHEPSGARGEARDSRDQLTNRREAFMRCVTSHEFRGWHSEMLRLILMSPEAEAMEAEVNRRVDEQMKPENLKIEYF